MRPSEKADVPVAGLSRKRREELFRKVNRPPEVIAMENISDKDWELLFRLPPDYQTSKDMYVRFLLYGSGDPRCCVYSEKPFSPENRPRETGPGGPPPNGPLHPPSTHD